MDVVGGKQALREQAESELRERNLAFEVRTVPERPRNTSCNSVDDCDDWRAGIGLKADGAGGGHSTTFGLWAYDNNGFLALQAGHNNRAATWEHKEQAVGWHHSNSLWDDGGAWCRDFSCVDLANYADVAKVWRGDDSRARDNVYVRNNEKGRPMHNKDKGAVDDVVCATGVGTDNIWLCGDIDATNVCRWTRQFDNGWGKWVYICKLSLTSFTMSGGGSGAPAYFGNSVRGMMGPDGNVFSKPWQIEDKMNVTICLSSTC